MAGTGKRREDVSGSHFVVAGSEQDRWINAQQALDTAISRFATAIAALGHA